MNAIRRSPSLLSLILSVAFMLYWLMAVQIVDGIIVETGTLSKAFVGESLLGDKAENRFAAQGLGLAVLGFLVYHCIAKFGELKRFLDQLGDRTQTLAFRWDAYGLARAICSLSGLVLLLLYLARFLIVLVEASLGGGQHGMAEVMLTGNGPMMVVVSVNLVAVHLAAAGYLMLRHWRQWLGPVKRRWVALGAITLSSLMGFIHYYVVP